jgi:hypothetical protein
VWRGRKEGRRERCERVKTGGRGEPFIWGDLACHVRCVSFGGPSFEPYAMSDTSLVHDDPDLPQNIAPRLGIPGKPDFFASVLRFIRTSAPGFPLDPVIFQSVILSVMAGNKHVLLRAKDEDISIVQSLAALVSNTILVCSLVGDCSLLFLIIEPFFPHSPRSFWYELTIPARYLPTHLATPLTNTR